MKRLKNSFKFAIEGLIHAFKKEENFKIHTTIGILVIIAGIILKVSLIEWVILIFVIGMVISAELFNTSVENLVDLITEEKKIEAKAAKDTAAACVMILSIESVIIGIIIFLPKIIDLIKELV